MKVISAQLQNFASYPKLDFGFNNQGLCLIQGPTGSGKSTLCDAIPWVLFGRTAKDGAVDEVVSWNAEGPTIGEIVLEVNPKVRVVVTRTRGKNANDLYFNAYDPSIYRQAKDPAQFRGHQIAIPTRGKDLVDTQKRLNTLLGIDSALYLSGAYYHEFSATAQFFTATAKNRRALCEQLVDLSLAKKLQGDLAIKRKEASTEVTKYTNKVTAIADRLQYLERDKGYKAKSETFEQDKADDISALETAILQTRKRTRKPEAYTNAIEVLKAEKQKLTHGKCKECGAPTHNKELIEIDKEIHALQLDANDNRNNLRHLNTLQTDLDKVKARENNFSQLIEQDAKDIKLTRLDLTSSQKLLANAKLQLADIDVLLEVVNDLRSVTIQNTIQQLEDNTNKLLSTHFDAEIKVLFSAGDADKIDVTILKDGNTASYTQLSKGQRCLLKLCFGVSVMKQVSNHHGVNFNCAFLDEALDGLDENMKLKALGLLRTLALYYENVFVVEHSEALKAHFDNTISVTLVNGESQLEQSQ